MITDFPPREGQVVWLVGQGLTDKEIARELNLSPNTVEGFQRTARARVGVRNRVELALYVHGIRL